MLASDLLAQLHRPENLAFQGDRLKEILSIAPCGRQDPIASHDRGGCTAIR
jgi:hypothetical protein